MNADLNQRPIASELHDIFAFWYNSIEHKNEESYQEEEKFCYKGKEIVAIFEEADIEILNISTSYDKNPDAIYTSRVFTFSNLPKPINSSIISLYINEEGNESNVFKILDNWIITNLYILIDFQDLN